MLQDLGNAATATMALLLLCWLLAAFLWRFAAPRAARLLLVGSVLLAIPACLVLGEINQARRYGSLHYAQQAEISDARVRAWIPAAAEDLFIESRATGLSASYRISLDALLEHLEHHWQRFAGLDHYADDRHFVSGYHAYQRQQDALHAQGLSEGLTLQGPRAANGAGSTFQVELRDDGLVQVTQQSSYW